MPVGEAQITRLNRERLAAIKNFLPIRDRFRDNLQRQQQARTESSIASAELFKPVTGVTKQVGTEVGTEIAKIAEQVKKAEETLQTIPSRIVTAQRQQRQQQQDETLRQLGEMDVSDIIPPPPEFSDKSQPEKKKEKLPRRDLDPKKIFTSELISLIREEKYKNDDDFANEIVDTYENRSGIMKEGYEDAINSKEEFTKKLYLARLGKSQLPRNDTWFPKLWNLVKQKSRQPPSYLVSQLTSAPIPEEIKVAAEPDLSTPLPQNKSGKGYYGGNIPCSRSIVDDISRLEVLVGAKRAGNNSPELLNEATEICQRLFRGHVIDIGMYRGFVDEFVDDYYSD
ncbi:hypothetical protein ACJMK2_038212 [Sinanodonta woodiana]|uniref:Uncharacterized protein n=1 Tax=Sinanodonta woodiana TaxID=1069815 RepID=A0ABD3WRY9_SINWO